MTATKDAVSLFSNYKLPKLLKLPKKKQKRR